MHALSEDIDAPADLEVNLADLGNGSTREGTRCAARGTRCVVRDGVHIRGSPFTLRVRRGQSTPPRACWRCRRERRLLRRGSTVGGAPVTV